MLIGFMLLLNVELPTGGSWIGSLVVMGTFSPSIERGNLGIWASKDTPLPLAGECALLFNENITQDRDLFYFGNVVATSPGGFDR